ncbi:polysaccharide biosynthesis/export family protein [Methylorubrum podarium]|uniref:polysaccharide biosynthesis/export family protein n=1 Tax=Methylorubrum podarium TaxID=200476 RepID=UPI001EE338D8|nr:polysaccharide biosynthesis/export family protein [Methylorubrum podarium]GJE73387.1 hypothetical protein CHKEEEPN_4952 [Methylorubrum podarium]
MVLGRNGAQGRLSVFYPSVLARSLAAACLVAAGTACTVTPRDGPIASAVRSSADVTIEPTPESVSYALVSLSPTALSATNRSTSAATPAFTRFVSGGRASQARIAPGDVLAITVFEASTGGLFLPNESGSRNGNFVQVPNQQVDGGGTINAPYAGTIRVVGMTPDEVGREIAQRLAKRAIEPQVVVTIAERRGNDISVLGDVNLPTRFSLDPGGMRVLGAVARAGGPRSPAYETLITVQRGARTEQALMTSLVKNPAQNIQLAAGDVVYISREPKIFLTLGATLPPGSVGGINNRRFPFDNDNMTLAEAIAKSGGLDDARADPSAVFIYRMEARRTLSEMGVDVSKYASELVPTIYTVDLNRADGMFLSNAFFMRNRDIIYVSTAPSTEINKFLGLTRNTTGLFYDLSLGAGSIAAAAR